MRNADDQTAAPIVAVHGDFDEHDCNTFTTTYDVRGRKIQTTDPDKGTTTFGYDDLDRVISTTDARGKKIFTSYDGLGRKTATREGTADGPLLTSFDYDTAKLGKGLAAGATRYYNNAQYVSNIREYNALGRVRSATVTIPQAEGPLAGTYSTVSEYNSDGTLRTLRPPVAGGLPYETLTNTHDALARPTRLTSSLGTYIDNVTYRATGEVQIMDFGPVGRRAFQTFHYQYGTQRLERANTSREGINGFARSALYHYTDAGTVTSITDTSDDGVDNQCFTYDHLQRLTEAWTQGSTDACAAEPAGSLIGGPAPYWHSFKYDKAGNRTNETRHGIGGVADTVRTFAYAPPGQGNRLNQVTETGPTGQRTDGYTYDATGNTTTIQTADGSPAPSAQTFDWNTEGELAKVTENGNDATFIYDADGNRLIRKDPGGTTLYLPGGTELRAFNGASTATGTRYYSFADQIVAMRTSDGNVTYLTDDHQGTAQVAVNAATLAGTVRRLTPFGSIRGMDEDATWPNDKGFVGGTQDPTGLTHLGAREYNPETGRFISVDPIMDQADPQQMNGYSYSNNNPVTHADPDGQCPPDICGAGVINVGHSKPATTGGCGHDVCTSPRRAADAARRMWQPVRVKISRVIINASSAAAYRAAFLQALLERGKSGLWVDKHEPLPDCIPGAAGRARGACAPGDLDILTRFGELICKIGGFKCGHISNSAYFKLGLAGFIPGQEGAGGHPGGVGGGRPPSSGKVPEADKPPKRGKAPEVSCRSSFVPGTTVLMANGDRKPIEAVEVGDEVIATDPETGETRAQPVLGTITSKGDKNLVQITVDRHATFVPLKTEGSTSTRALVDRSGVVIATDTHPFWVAGDIDAWVEAADLKPGMWLRTSVGTYVQITATKLWTTHHQRVHNLTIANTHTYHVGVGNDSVLVHNRGCVRSYSSHARDQMEERGLTEDMVEQTVENGKKRRGNRPGTHKYKTKNIWVVVNSNGHVVSVGRN
ncbi:DUF4258 domain-containing protein [Actinomadura soli]|uniref:DUF4258 domain-containing protein n=1 Tax=Actinomadura soli TaxID=2508997 RepID=A0A5C4J005_9ACTN|nr:RHS repeat-associated core domain-containing protein [Actinomadura soli]TMQ89765.1 DUF4258 domain-containing protein [Actinomadura soli]